MKHLKYLLVGTSFIVLPVVAFLALMIYKWAFLAAIICAVLVFGYGLGQNYYEE